MKGVRTVLREGDRLYVKPVPLPDTQSSIYFLKPKVYLEQIMITRHDIDPNCYNISEKEFPAIIQIQNHQEREITVCHGMGMLIHADWILTAAHVANELKSPPDSISVGGQYHRIKMIFIHPNWKDANNIKSIKNDIALIQLECPALEISPLSLYSANDEIGQIVTFVGWGDYGNGVDGVLGADGQLRASRNRIEEADEQWLVFHFDEPPNTLDLEGISGPGDSGGPALIETETGWVLAGISSAQSSEAEYSQEEDWQQKEGQEGVYGVWEYYTRVSQYIDWIRATISQNENLSN